MQSEQENNKRIAKNTVFLYFRTFIIMLVSLYTSRAVLDALGETDFGSIFTEYMLFQLMMNIEIAAICFVISAVSKKNRLGIGISVAMLLYVYDLMARVVPDLKDAIFISPFSYSNATSIFAGESRDCVALILGTIMIVIMTVGAGMIYAKRDLAS